MDTYLTLDYVSGITDSTYSINVDHIVHSFKVWSVMLCFCHTYKSVMFCPKNHSSLVILDTLFFQSCTLKVRNTYADVHSSLNNNFRLEICVVYTSPPIS